MYSAAVKSDMGFIIVTVLFDSSTCKHREVVSLLHSEVHMAKIVFPLQELMLTSVSQTPCLIPQM